MTTRKGKFKDLYRIPSARLETWDYGWNGHYFVTICVYQHICCLGSINDDCFHPHEWGKIVSDCWMAIPEHFPFVQLGAFVIMPNHVHGIICIEKDADPDLGSEEDTDDTFIIDRFGNQGKATLSSIVGSFKSACSKRIRKEYPDTDFRWQERFHEHIIRTEEAYNNISWYIINNPAKWQEDRFHVTY